MKEGTKVKVKANRTGHGFCLGEIVERRASELDDEFGVGFMCDKDHVWYMQPDEYEIVDRDHLVQLLKEAKEVAIRQGFSCKVHKEIREIISLVIEESKRNC